MKEKFNESHKISFADADGKIHEIKIILMEGSDKNAIFQKMQYAIDHLEPKKDLIRIREIRHFAGTSNHACEIRISDGSSVFLRLPGDPLQIIGKMNYKNSNGAFVDRKIEQYSIQAIEKNQVNGIIDSEEGEMKPCPANFCFDEDTVNAGYKIEKYFSDCETLNEYLDNDQVKTATMNLMRKFHSKATLETWLGLTTSQSTRYDVTEQIILMLEAVDNIQDGCTPSSYRSGLGVHEEKNERVIVRTTIPERAILKKICSDYAALKERMNANLEEDHLRLCHNDLGTLNFLSSGNVLREGTVSSDNIRVIDLEFSGLNDPMFDLAHLVTQRRDILLSDEKISFLLKAYHTDKDVSEEQIEKEKDRIAFYVPLVHFKGTCWAAYQTLLGNESAERHAIRYGWGTGGWKGFLTVLEDNFITSRFERNGCLSALNEIRSQAVRYTSTEHFYLENVMNRENIIKKLNDLGSRYFTIRLRNAESIQAASEFINNLEFENDDIDSIDPIDPLTWQRLGEAATHAGLYDKAKKFYQNSLGASNSTAISSEEHRIIALCNLGLGVISRECTGASESFAFFIEGLNACDKMNKEDSGYYEIFTDLKRNYGIALAKNKNYDKAVTQFGEALEDDHRCPEYKSLLLPIQSWFGYVTVLAGNHEKGMERLAEARVFYDQIEGKESSLDYATHCFQMGDAHLKMENYLPAINELETSLKIREEFLKGRNRLRVVDSYFLLAQCHKMQKQHEQEKKFLTKIIALLENYPEYTWPNVQDVSSRLQQLKPDKMSQIYLGNMHLSFKENQSTKQKDENVSRLTP